MEARRIEKYDKTRTNMLIGVALGITFFFSSNIFEEYFQGAIMEGVLTFIEIAGSCILLFCVLRLVHIKLLIRKNPALKAALKNEWILNNLQKARAQAFFFVFFSLIMSYFINLHSSVPALLLMKICILVAILSVLISFVFFNREQ